MAHRIGRVQKTRVHPAEIGLGQEALNLYGGTGPLSYEGLGMHHSISFHSVDAEAPVDIQVSNNGSDWVTVKSITKAAVYNTGNIYEPSPRFTRVKAAGASDNKFTVLSFSSLIPSP